MKHDETVTVIGCGAMGTLCALIVSRHVSRVRLWGRKEDFIEEIGADRENRRFLPGHRLPDHVTCSSDVGAVGEADWLLVAVPCQFLRKACASVAPAVKPGVPVVSVVKGIENETLMTPIRIVVDVWGERSVCALSGPSIAPEVADGLPVALVAASADAALAERIQARFTTETVRTYTNPDPVGVELAGAMKNVIALAAGMIDGLGLGNNTKAALLTRGLVEITRLGVALGAERETFAGLTGLGDLVTTCFSPVGRNRSAGQLFGEGKTLDEVLGATASVIEGIPTTRSILALAGRAGIEMPISRGVGQIIFEGRSPRDVMADLMTREPKPEQDSFT
jgi:glycerol-3-phosphate dehydrogenase (NAD(P)+)